MQNTDDKDSSVKLLQSSWIRVTNLLLTVPVSLQDLHLPSLNSSAIFIGESTNLANKQRNQLLDIHLLKFAVMWIFSQPELRFVESLTKHPIISICAISFQSPASYILSPGN